MSWLFIDTHERGRMQLAVLPQAGRVRHRTIEGRVSPVVALSRVIRPGQALTGVAVVQGPGPFSTIRAGVLVANLIARLKKIPLVGIPIVAAADLQTLRNALVAGEYAATQYVAPLYDAEPNITSKPIR